MLADAMRTLYGYNRWATERVLDAVDRLTAEQLNAPGDAGHRSVRDTLLHLLETHRGWLSWWDGSLSATDAYNRRLDRDRFPDAASIRCLWREIDQQTDAFLAGLSDEDAARVYPGVGPDGRDLQIPLVPMLLHVANHNTQHRSEAAAMSTSFGHSPGDLDLIYYHFATAASVASGANGADR